jgi:hypothetical protein
VADLGTFDRRSFEGIPSEQLTAQRSELLADLEAPTTVPTGQEDVHARLDSALTSVREQLDRKVAELSTVAASSGTLTPDDVRGVADLWVLSRETELGEMLRAAVDAEAAAVSGSVEGLDADPDVLRSRIAAVEAELVLRVAEEQLASVDQKLEPFFAERLVEQVFARYRNHR